MPQWTARPRASLLSPRIRALNTTPKKYLQDRPRTGAGLDWIKALSVALALPLSQFTVLDEDALGELLSFFEDLLVVNVGHG